MTPRDFKQNKPQYLVHINNAVVASFTFVGSDTNLGSCSGYLDPLLTNTWGRIDSL